MSVQEHIARVASVPEDMRRMIIPYVTAICGERFNSSVEACAGHVEARLWIFLGYRDSRIYNLMYASRLEKNK